MHSIQDLFPEELRLLDHYINWIRLCYKKKIFTEELTEERYEHMKNVLENVVNAYETLNYEINMVAPSMQLPNVPVQNTRYSPLHSISPNSPAPMLDLSVIPQQFVADRSSHAQLNSYMMGTPISMPPFSTMGAGALMPVMQMPHGMMSMIPPNSPQQRENININMTVNTSSDARIPLKSTVRTARATKNHTDRVCTNCKITDTVQWRAGPQGKGTLCNKCGLKWAKEEGLHKSYSKKTPTKKRKSEGDPIETSIN